MKHQKASFLMKHHKLPLLSVQLYCTMQQSDSSLLLCQINIEVSGAPFCSLASARCLRGGKGRVSWELPLSSFILTKLALDFVGHLSFCI